MQKEYLRALLLIQFLAISTLSWASTCTEGDCKNGYGEYVWDSGHKYTGTWKNNRKHGYGVSNLASGDKYAGKYINNKRVGRGTYTWIDGTKYIGEWINNERTGQGTQIWPNGKKYVGKWLNGDRYGKGTQINADGDKYVGDWKYDKKSGKGTYSWKKTGSIFVGEFFNNSRVMGTQTYSSGNEYVGGFMDNDYHGKGILSYASGRIIKGIWVKGKYIGTQAEVNAQKSREQAALNTQKRFEEQAKIKYDKIYNACLIDKGSKVDMTVSNLNTAVRSSCKAIAENPSWYNNIKYNL